MNKKYKVYLFTALAYVLANEQYKHRKALEEVANGMKDHNKVLQILIEKDAVLKFIEDFGKTKKPVR